MKTRFGWNLFGLRLWHIIFWKAMKTTVTKSQQQVWIIDQSIINQHPCYLLLTVITKILPPILWNLTWDFSFQLNADAECNNITNNHCNSKKASSHRTKTKKVSFPTHSTQCLTAVLHYRPFRLLSVERLLSASPMIDLSLYDCWNIAGNRMGQKTIISFQFWDTDIKVWGFSLMNQTSYSL